ncbi:hypothetical protein BOTBODRAFT_138428 [Botryobasidium botryosum FD-172 SS1]|uniref:Mitochondrial inner membrane protease subunit n=1 Tax=Botryobasidium botryosum (strain FD-172 SS1) TaxID=930990 RepID=A0A067MAL2_BOTB1|nr:hypothetical protein BOTBODRAFT_138428 [Botryobasidium botryosum FD-172 SS1]
MRKQHPLIGITSRWLPWLVTAVVFTKHVATVKVVSGRSMQPTLNPDMSKMMDVVLLNRLVTTDHNFERGDVVTLKSPTDHKHMIIKRIIALEGDIVRTRPPHSEALVSVPQGHIWVEGDEPFHTHDSNTFGPVPLGLVDGRVERILFPLSRWGPLGMPSRVQKEMSEGLRSRVLRATLKSRIVD